MWAVLTGGRMNLLSLLKAQHLYRANNEETCKGELIWYDLKCTLSSVYQPTFPASCGFVCLGDKEVVKNFKLHCVR